MQVENTIVTKLEQGLSPSYLTVENESHQHNVPPGSESHFKVVIVSKAFDDKRKVARHQAIYRLLADELAGAVHALALHTYTETEWQQVDASPESPQCLGGSKGEQ